MTTHDEPLDLARRLLTEAREELVRADSKAALLLAAVGVVAGALLAALLAQSWEPSLLSNAVEWLWWAGVVAVAVAIVALAVAVYPRTDYRGTKPDFIGYFGDVVVTADDAVEAALEATAKEPGLVVVDQLNAVAAIVDGKYKLIQLALKALAAGGGACLISVLINMFL